MDKGDARAKAIWEPPLIGTLTENSISKFSNILQAVFYDFSDTACVYMQWVTGEKIHKVP